MDKLAINGFQEVPMRSLHAWLIGLTPDERRQLKKHLWEVNHILDELIEADFKKGDYE